MLKILANLITCLAVVVALPILLIVAVGHLFYKLFSSNFAIWLFILGLLIITVINLVGFWAFRM